MWIRRNNVFARNGHNNGVGPNIQSPNSSNPPFNPNHRRYRTCCCHSKTFTLSFGMIELFLICFILVAVGPDFNNKYCINHHHPPPPNSPLPPPPPAEGPPPQEGLPQPPPPNDSNNNNTASETHLEVAGPMAKRRRKRQLLDEAVPSGLPQSATVPDVMALIGQKSPLTPETPPNNGETNDNKPIINETEENIKMEDQEDPRAEASINRISWIIIILLIIGAIISTLFYPPHSEHLFGQIILCIFLFILCLIIMLFVKSQIACIQFVKRSAETGFSISNTRPFAPPSTASQSDGARPNEQVRKVVHTSIRKLPGPSAKRYQQENISSNQNNFKKQNSIEDENNNFSQMTMTTLAALGTSNSSGNSTTRPSTAGSLMQTNRSGVIKGFVGVCESNIENNPSSRGSSAEERRSTPLNSLNGGIRETNFGGEVRVINGTLPPLRHTYKINTN
uniref:Uncharacterized protein n=1 Tax=Meloidogyne hapla TaxID=6305 RepID=A0A1I8BZT2_MELHA